MIEFFENKKADKKTKDPFSVLLFVNAFMWPSNVYSYLKISTVVCYLDFVNLDFMNTAVDFNLEFYRINCGC